MRDTDMKIRLDEDLKQSFFDACESLDITASQRLRQMMKSWVDEMREEGVISTPKKRQWSEAILRRAGK